MGESKFTIDTADPSWFPRVLRTLARDYPEINDKVWSTAIGENAADLAARPRCPETTDGAHTADWYDGRRCGACGQEGPEPDDEPEPAEYDPGPEVDDEGGMSEYRYHEPEPWT